MLDVAKGVPVEQRRLVCTAEDGDDMMTTLCGLLRTETHHELILPFSKGTTSRSMNLRAAETLLLLEGWWLWRVDGRQREVC